MLKWIALIGCALATPALSRSQAIVVDRAVIVSPEGTGDHEFTTIAADPEDARALIACGFRARSRSNSWQGFVYRTGDGGVHWTPVLIDSAAQSESEESCAYGPEGHAYFIAQGWNEGFERGRLGDGILRLYRSLDAGATWTPVMVDPTRFAWMDYSRLAVDATNGPYRGRLYIFSNDGVADPPDRRPLPPLRYSIDDGLHVSDRVASPMTVLPFGGFPQSVAVLPSGAVVAAYLNRYASDGSTPPPIDTTKVITAPRFLNLIQVTRSNDGGRSLGRLVTIDHATGFPGLAVDASAGPYRGRVYVVWTDTVSGVSRVRLATSSDEGATWTTPRTLSEVSPSSRPASDTTEPWPPGAMEASVAVNRDGVVGLAWSENWTCWYFSASRDGGRTFLPTVPLNPCPRRAHREHDPNQRLYAVAKVYVTGPVMGRDPRRHGFTVFAAHGGVGASGLTADADGVFHPLFSIGGTAGELWTTRVVVQPTDTPAQPRSVSLAGLVDATSRVGFSVTYEHYDAGSGELTVDLVVESTDSLPLRGPLWVELTRIESSMASRIEVENADNEVRGTGAVWSIDAGTGGGALAGYARSRPRRLAFHLSEGSESARTAGNVARGPKQLLGADLQVLASPSLP